MVYLSLRLLMSNIVKQYIVWSHLLHETDFVLAIFVRWSGSLRTPFEHGFGCCSIMYPSFDVTSAESAEILQQDDDGRGEITTCMTVLPIIVTQPLAHAFVDRLGRSSAADCRATVST